MSLVIHKRDLVLDKLHVVAGDSNEANDEKTLKRIFPKNLENNTFRVVSLVTRAPEYMDEKHCAITHLHDLVVLSAATYIFKRDR